MFKHGFTKFLYFILLSSLLTSKTSFRVCTSSPTHFMPANVSVFSFLTLSSKNTKASSNILQEDDVIELTLARVCLKVSPRVLLLSTLEYLALGWSGNLKWAVPALCVDTMGMRKEGGLGIGIATFSRDE